MDTPKKTVTIGIFDSGLGSLSIARAIRRKLPSLNLIICADNKNFPYGTKSEATVLHSVLESIEATLRLFSLEMIVIACNTASTIVLSELRKLYSIPIIGVVPAIKTAAKLSTTRRIGLLATRETVSRPYTDTLVRNFAKDCTVLRVGSSRLVEMAENKVCGISPDVHIIQEELAPFFWHEEKKGILDAIVLGCTHFPLLLPELSQAVPHPVEWVDSGEAIARRVETLLHGLSLDHTGQGKSILTFTSSTVHRNIPSIFLEKEGIELLTPFRQPERD